MTSFSTTGFSKASKLQNQGSSILPNLLLKVSLNLSSHHTDFNKTEMSGKTVSRHMSNTNQFSEPLKSGLSSDDESSIESENDLIIQDAGSTDNCSSKRPFSSLGIQNESSLPNLDSSDVSSHSTPLIPERTVANSSKKRRRKRNRVALHESVVVIPIPSRFDYSIDVRETLWSSSAELCANAARNSVEFESEGWNWRSVVEDEHMIVHKSSGELIHPIHIHNALACMKNRDNSQENEDVKLISYERCDIIHSPKRIHQIEAMSFHSDAFPKRCGDVQDNLVSKQLPIESLTDDIQPTILVTAAESTVSGN